MSQHCGYIVEVKELKPHTNADKLQLATFFGETVIVGLDTKIGDIGVYFPCDLQLSLEYCDANDLCKKRADGTDGAGYMDRDKRNVTAIRLRGEKSYGLYAPLSSLAFTGVDLSIFKVGDIIDTVAGISICQKYIPRRPNRAAAGQGSHTRKKKVKSSLPYFVEHVDTPQLRYNLSMFKPGDIICLTEKVHGTSSRNGYTLSIKPQTWLQKLFHIKTSKYVDAVGTRRTLITENNGGYYGTNAFRMEWAEKFKGKLIPGEQVFGEIAGFYDFNAPIMAVCNNAKVNDKQFMTYYGATTTFSYGCSPTATLAPLNRYFIYRMTYTTPEGHIIEYPWDVVQQRAFEMGFETVPELERFIYTTEEDFLARINKYLDTPSCIDPHHIREGVVIRALNAVNFKVAKEKSWNFKVLEGIVKSEAVEPDLEEAEDLL